MVYSFIRAAGDEEAATTKYHSDSYLHHLPLRPYIYLSTYKKHAK